MKILKGEPMANHTTFRVGGPADRFLCVGDSGELAEALDQCRQEGTPFHVIGRGSNLLVSDDGFRGTIICTADGFSRIRVEQETADGAVLYAEGGATLAALAGFAREHALTGLEFAAGIPGTVGGGILMNAGAYGGELCDVTSRVHLIGKTGDQVVKERGEMAFSYRTSAVKGSGEIVTGAAFSLKKGDRETIGQTMEELAKKRMEKQPLNFASAGSTWKRPPGQFAAKLIEEAGCKGLSVGDAQISEKHAGFLINRGAARASQIRELMRQVEERVFENSGIRLEPEIVMIGEF
ncbi:MAG: UDP-N-acetylmuramate dehydrogenase [Lachnospiraceae bacterium]|nr:UDP-N-acetylmuramate dehydrogenase [Lachnospiraceae bacterium]